MCFAFMLIRINLYVLLIKEQVNAMKKIHFIWAHPRTDSLTAHIVASMKSYVADKGLPVTELDLYRSGFNPVMYEVDEPRWDNINYKYTEEVQQLFESLKGVDTLVIVFPVWWYSFPAILKGYIDRVWTNGLAYGKGNKVPVNKIRWIALTGETKEAFNTKGNYTYMNHMMIKSLSDYCGVIDAKVEFLYDTIGFEGERDKAHYDALFVQANTVIDEILS